ncbi:DUF2242 domain-containing protein [Pseudomonas putida]|uniref:DUF2242 domain-containing protein n=1 Tax=Pseudomonas putida TaxID=303 RepID=UPI0023645F62|nr:DUF2242 domain-containing protein [Pseudomonas putida]MDD2052370.1 DUF2242 domain-containing protein [Pseudomonas putida]
MFRSFHLRVVALGLLLAGAAGCSTPKQAIYEHENFDDSGTFSRNYPVSDAASCEAARRALLSQGYIITSSDPKLISGNKSFQQTGESHLQISFSVVCAPDGSAAHRSTMFANALQDRYALKKVNNSASLGVGVLGSVSMPIGSTDDSMVKVASETVSSAKFYERFFALVELFLPPEVKQAEPVSEQPKADLGVPEAPPASAPAVPPAAPVVAPEPTPAVSVEPTPAPEPASAPVLEDDPVTVPATTPDTVPATAPATAPAESAPTETPASTPSPVVPPAP